MVDKVSICSAASVMVGDNPISAIPSASRASQVLDQIYENTVMQLLAAYPWKFAKAQANLSKLTATPEFTEFKNAFQLPADFVRAIRVEHKKPYRLHQKYIYSNQDVLKLEYLTRPPESFWPLYFVRVVELKFAWYLSLSLAEDNTKAKMFEAEFMTAMRDARAIDSQDQPPSRIVADVLIKARYSDYEDYDG